ncbi:MAG: hypothetical protein WCQ60_03935, partial [bacterium]
MIAAPRTGTGITVTSKTAGTSFSLSLSTDLGRTFPEVLNVVAVPAVAQVSNAIPPTYISVGDVFTVTINGTVISYTATDTLLANVLIGLRDAINASAQAANVTASVSGNTVSIISDIPGTPFTLGAITVVGGTGGDAGVGGAGGTGGTNAIGGVGATGGTGGAGGVSTAGGLVGQSNVVIQ